jgi:hypothetical protein
MLEANNCELATLNKRRKALLRQVSLLKKHQAHCLTKIQHDVSSYVDDHAEKYFGAEGDFANRPFSQRFGASLKAMVTN